LASPPITQGEGGHFGEGTCKIKKQAVLGDFFSILKEYTIPIGFANLLTTSVDLFGEFTFASLIPPHKKLYECVFTLASKHQQGFNQVRQRILGDLFGMFEAALFTPKTITRAQFFTCSPQSTGRQWFQIHSMN
jgi:hypothetical protein